MVGTCGSRPCEHNQKCYPANDIYGCEDLDCYWPVIKNGKMKLSDPGNTTFRATATVQCNTGYVSSQPIVKCLLNSSWEKASCIATEKTNYGDEAIVTCDAGYLSSKSNVTCLSNSTWENVFCKVPVLVTDCKDVKDLDHTSSSGVYNITLWQSRKVIQVYCDMDTDGGGWTVFQRRFNNVTDFYRGIKDYRDGFGSIEGEFWLGLTNIREIADQNATYLRVNMTRADGTTGFELLSNFRLEGDNFTFSADSLVTEGFAGDEYFNMELSLHQGFSTYDHNVYIYPDTNCAVLSQGAWWYRYCDYIDLNGKYCTPGTECYGFFHFGFDVYYGLNNSAMMIKRMV